MNGLSKLVLIALSLVFACGGGNRTYTPKYGLASVDPVTFKRTAKPSASYLGKIAQDNR